MAKLKETLVGTGGKSRLGLSTEEDIKALSARKGRALPPTAPAEANQLGASPDQAKMTGSSANLKSTLKEAASAEAPSPAVVSSNYTLDKANLWRQAREEQTTGEQLQRQLADKLSKSSSHLIADTGKAAKDKFVQASQSTEKLKLQLKDKLNVTPDEQTQVDILLNPEASEQQRASAFNILKDKVPPGLSLKDAISAPDAFASTWISNLENIGTQLGRKVSENVADEVLVSDLYSADEMQGLADSIGVPVADVPNMTAQELQAAFGSKIDTDFVETERLRKLAADPNASASERAEATRQLKDLGATGVVALEESEIQKLDKSIQEADKVEVAGKTYSVAELLDNEAISAMISNYVNEGIGADTLSELGIKGWVDTNKNALQKMSADLEDSTRNLAKRQQSQKARADQVAAMIGGGVSGDALFGESFIWNDLPLNILNIPKEDQALLAGHNFGSELMSPEVNTEENLKKLANFERGGRHVLSDLDQAKKDKQVAASGDPNAIIDNLVGLVKEARRMQAAGESPSNPYIDRVDKDHDGNLDEDWASAFTGQDTSLKGLLAANGNVDIMTIDKLANALNTARAPASAGGQVSPDMLDDKGNLNQAGVDKLSGPQLRSLSSKAFLFSGANPDLLAKAAGKLMQESPPPEFEGMSYRDYMIYITKFSGPTMYDTRNKLKEFRDKAESLRKQASSYPRNSPLAFAYMDAAKQMDQLSDQRITEHDAAVMNQGLPRDLLVRAGNAEPWDEKKRKEEEAYRNLIKNKDITTAYGNE